MSDRKKLDALQVNKLRCILSIVFCSLICVFVFLGVCEQLVVAPKDTFPEVGWKAYHLFTILSNLLMAVSAAMCIPYAVDGLRNHNYHLPRWYVDLMYVGTTGVTVTFVVALTVLSPAVSFYKMMLWSNNLHLHTISPILSIVLFFYINSDHKIDFKKTFLAMAPATAYAIVYIIMVFVIGQEAGGWRDHYEIGTVLDYVSLPVATLIFLVVCFILATVLRTFHNLIHRDRKADLEEFYKTSETFDHPDIEAAVRALARENKTRDKGGELTLPRRAMTILEKKYKSGLSMEQMCNIYLNEYYH